MLRARTNVDGTQPGVIWEDLDTGAKRKSHEVAQDPAAALVVEQHELALVKEEELLPLLLPKVAVFGRMLPSGKVEVIEALQGLGYMVGMCGDGGNDCGAMRAAHAGLALSAGDSSIVAPFSASTDHSLLRLVDLLREGRACLLNNIMCFVFFVNYGVLITTAKSVLLIYGKGKLMSEWSYIYFDGIINIFVPLAMVRCAPAEILSPFRPGARIVSKRIIAYCIINFVMFWGLVVPLLVLLQRQPFYMPWEPSWFGIPTRWGLLSDNFECSLFFLLLSAHTATTGLLCSYGGHHRRALFVNWRLLLVFAGVMGGLAAFLFTESTSTNCIIKVELDRARLDFMKFRQIFVRICAETSILINNCKKKL